MTGRNSTIASVRNVPSFSIGVRVPININPETRNMIPDKFKTPSPDKYNVPADNVYFKKVGLAPLNEKKFFEP